MEFPVIPQMYLDIYEKFGDSKEVLKYKKPGDESFSEMNYQELTDEVTALALGLKDLGIKKGDRIGIVSENRYEWIIADLAIVGIGGVDVPIFPTQTSKQEEFIFTDASVVAIIVSNDYQLAKVMEFKDRLKSLRHVFVMNGDFKTDDVAVKSMQSLIDRGKSLKSFSERLKIYENEVSGISIDDLITIIYTSGTTGNPKGVMLTHKNISSNMHGFLEVIEFNENDTFLSFLPLCHSYERTTGYYGALLAGSTIALAESVETVGSNILEIQPTLMTTVPKFLETIKKKIYNKMEKESTAKRKLFHWAVDVGKKVTDAADKGKKPLMLSIQYKLAEKMVFSKIREKINSRLRLFASGGAALPYDVAEFFRAIGIVVIEGYGLTEASPVLAANRIENNEIGTVGKEIGFVEIKIAGDGEILARGPNIMKGYWNDKLSTNDAFDEEGWLYTGDIGKITERGNIKITDRKKNIFVSKGGKNIAPQPIENVLQQSKYIEHVVLIGDKREFITALITPDFNRLGELAEEFGIEFNDESELISNNKIVYHIKKDIDYLQRDFAKFERVRRFRLLSRPFSIENGELSPKLSIKRHVVERQYADFIEQMYKM